ncbi:MAG: hypothetical protein NVSMB27_23900 [Ktedonobacteraceae bacterium]
MIVYRTYRNARATQDALRGELGDLRIDLPEDRGMIKVGDTHLGRERHRAGQHTAITANTHINFKTYVFRRERPGVLAMQDSHYRICLRGSVSVHRFIYLSLSASYLFCFLP